MVAEIGRPGQLLVSDTRRALLVPFESTEADWEQASAVLGAVDVGHAPARFARKVGRERLKHKGERERERERKIGRQRDKEKG